MLQPFLRDGESSLQIRKKLDLGSDFFFFMNDRDQNHADWMIQMLPINSNQWLSMIDSRSVVIYIRLSIYFFHSQSYHRNPDGKGSTHPLLLRARYKNTWNISWEVKTRGTILLSLLMKVKSLSRIPKMFRQGHKFTISKRPSALLDLEDTHVEINLRSFDHNEPHVKESSWSPRQFWSVSLLFSRCFHSILF